MKTMIRILALLLLGVMAIGQNNLLHPDAVEITKSLLPDLYFKESLIDQKFKRRIEREKYQESVLSEDYVVRLDSVYLTGIDSLTGKEVRGYGAFFEYNDQKLLSAQTISIWSEGLNMWLGVFRDEFFYNESYKISEIVTYEPLNDLVSWGKAYKTVYRYEYGFIIESEEFEWDGNSQDWEPLTRTEYRTFGTRIFKSTEYMWDVSSKSWHQYALFESIYYQAGFGPLYQYKASYWDDLKFEWELRWVIEHNYDNEWRRTGTFYIDVYGDNWFTHAWEDYHLNAKGDVTVHTYLEWSYDLGDFENRWKEEYEYDNDRSLTRQSSALWDPLPGKWEFDRLVEYNYNKRYGMDDILLPAEIISSDIDKEVLFRYMLTGTDEFEWDSFANEWAFVGKSNYYYSDLATSVREITVRPLNIYPNPSTGQIIVSASDLDLMNAEVNIFDVYGRSIYDRPIGSNGTMDISNLTSGVYRIIIVSDGIGYVGSVTIQR